MKTNRAFAFAAAVALLAASAGAAELGWTAGPMSADGSTIRTDGTLLYAYSVRGGTVGGVTFTSASDFANAVQVSASPAPTGYVFSDFQNAGASGDFGHMLEGGWYWGYNGAASGELSATVTLTGLTAGKTYLVQLVVHRTSNSTLVSANGSTPVHIHGTHDGVNYTYGGTIVGVFTATGATADVVVTYSAASSGMRPLNAIQVRDLGGGQGGGATVVAPSIGSASATTNGTTATIALSGLVMGTDDEGVAASSYSVSYSLTNAPAVTALSNQSGATASFDIANLADGNYSCEVTITTDKGKTATKSVSFTIGTSGQGGGGGDIVPVADGWTAVALGSTSASIRTDGTLKYAYAFGNYTANGVPFVGSNGLINNADCVVWEATGGAQSFGSSAPSDTESDGYKNLLENGWWANAKKRPIQLNNLESGKRYLVQIIGFRKNYTTQTATAPDGKQTIKFDGEGWEYGGSLVGIFTASGTSQEFLIDYVGQACINAIQVRELSAEPDPSSKPLVIAVE